MTHYLDIFMSEKNVGLNGLRLKKSNVLLGLGTRGCLLARQHLNSLQAAHPNKINQITFTVTSPQHVCFGE